MEWGIVYYATAKGEVPAEAFLDACPRNVDATFNAVLEAVRAAPPPAFSGGGRWEAMHGAMAGFGSPVRGVATTGSSACSTTAAPLSLPSAGATGRRSPLPRPIAQ